MASKCGTVTINEQAFAVVLILSDGLDRGDLSPLTGAMRAIHRRARKVLWLNPLAGDRRRADRAGDGRRNALR